jgi:transcriptional regulator with XRE-family HTH domain
MSLGNTLKKNFAKNLQNLRTKKDLTQANLADALNNKYKDHDIQLKRTSIVNYETEEAMPRIDALYCIADYFEKTIDQIISPTMDKPLLTNFLDLPGIGAGPIVDAARSNRYRVTGMERIREKGDVPASDLDIDGILTTCVDGIMYKKFYVEFLKALYQKLYDDAPTTEDKEKFEKTFYKTFLGCRMSKSKYLQDTARNLLEEQEFEVFMAFQDSDTSIETVAKANGLTVPRVVEIFNKAQYKLSSFTEEKPTHQL